MAVKIAKVSMTKEELKRNHKVITLLNDREMKAFEGYCKRYKIKNKSKVIRDMVFTTIFESYDRDYPTLFDKQVMADLIVERR